MKTNSKIRGNTMRKLQQRAIDSGYLDNIGANGTSFDSIVFDAVAATLVDIAITMMILGQENLRKVDRISSATLSDSISPDTIVIEGDKYSINVNLASYYDYVNQGVKGWEDGGGNSPYQFKQYSTGGGNGRSKMVSAIRKWLIKEGLKQRTTSVNQPLKGNIREHSRLVKKAQGDNSTRTAIVIAKNIKQHGLEPTHFWDKTVKEIQQQVATSFAAALKVDVINNLSSWH